MNLDFLMKTSISSEYGILKNLESTVHPFCSELQIALVNGSRRGKKYISSGADFNKDIAKIKALMEGLERYSSAILPKNKVYTALVSKLNCRVFSPIDFNSFTEHQNVQAGRPTWSDDLLTTWVQATDLKEEPYYIPSSAAFLNNSTAPDFLPISSSGCAAGLDTNEVKLNALLENIERDSFINHWRTGIKPKEITFGVEDTISNAIDKLFHHLPRRKVNFKFYLLNSEFGSCNILAVGTGLDSRWPALAVAAASHPNKETALQKALYELYLVYFYFYKNFFGSVDFNQPCPLAQNELSDFSAHATYYYYYKNFCAVRDFFSADHSIEFGSIPSITNTASENLNLLDQQLRSNGLTPLFFDHTTRDVRSLGVQVWRSIVPGLSFINASHSQITLHPKRYQQFYNHFNKSIQQNFEINSLPHFFP